MPSEAEIDFLLETAADYLRRPPSRADILSVFAGIRPLVRSGETKETAALSRDHTIQIDATGLVTIAGGKWTTYRQMAEDCIDLAAILAELPERPCVTKSLNIHGFHENGERFGDLAVYGSDALEIMDLIRADPSLATPLDPRLPNVEAEVVWASRREMARTVEDVLARRTRMLFLDARAAIAAAPRVAALLRVELEKDESWESSQIEAFRTLAQGYLVEERG